MAQLEMGQFKTKTKQDFVKLLDFLAHVLASDNYLSFGDADENERLSIARGLTDKFVNHAVTMLYLSSGTKQDLPSFKLDSFLNDFASIDVLTRVLLEACLTFHHVFYASATKEDKNYRYWTYKAAGIIENRSFPALTEKFKQKLAEEEKELDKLCERLKSNTVFQSLTDKQKKRILRGEWRLKSWREIAIDAGFSGMIALQIYRHLSGVAHSSFLSVLQSVEIQRNRVQEEAIIKSQMITNAVVANMIREYCGLLPKAREIWNTHREVKESVEWWIKVDRGLDELTSIGQRND